MKKNCVIFFNCHGGQYRNFLQNSPQFNKIYNVQSVSISYYIKDSIHILTNVDKNIIKNADLLICQFLQNSRGELTNNFIKSLVKKNARVIMLPHYRSDMYMFTNLIPHYKTSIYNGDIPQYAANNYLDKPCSLAEYKMKLKNLTEIPVNISKDIVVGYHNKCLEEFEKIEKEQSSIRMIDFFKDNYKKIKLFGTRPYPRPYFFFIATKKILEIINIHDLPTFDKCHNYQQWEHTIIPIPNNIRKLCGFTFPTENGYLVDHAYPVKDIFEYYYKIMQLNKNNK